MGLLDKFRKKKTIGFDKKVLRKNDISLLIVDERWNSLFKIQEKTPKILQCEDKLKHLLKEQSRLVTEQKEIIASKKNCMSRIIQLTEVAYEDNNSAALDEMQHCQSEITRINTRLKEIEQELEVIPGKIEDANIMLLEETVNVVYAKIKNGQQRINELNMEIATLKNKLRSCINEKQELNELVGDAYSYFHDLLGREELERLDKENL